MARWLIYLKERFPLPTYFLLVGGISLSGLLLGSGVFETKGFAISLFGLLLFFILLRLMDELKDYKKDLLAHPERPLPRGILKATEVGRAINGLSIFMLIFAGITLAITNSVAAVSYVVITVYLWFMYKEFFVGDWLSSRPLLYAITHQVIVIPLCSFVVTTTQPDLLVDKLTLYFGLSVLAAFFSYEICRKLDPKAHPILKTYLSLYGPLITSVLVVAASLIAAWSSSNLGLKKLLWPIEGLLVLSLVILFLKPEKYKVVEGVAAFSLLIHLWALPIRYFTGWPK